MSLNIFFIHSFGSMLLMNAEIHFRALSISGKIFNFIRAGMRSNILNLLFICVKVACDILI